jgi:hypothetical protein
MVAVGIAALDFGAIRTSLEFRSMTNDLLVLGALPMANLLAVGILIGLRNPGSRPFLLGFEAFGAMALIIYVALASFYPAPHGPIDSYLALLIKPLVRFVGRDHPFVSIPVFYTSFVVVLGWPQVALAFIGGSLSRRFKSIVTPR